MPVKPADPRVEITTDQQTSSFWIMSDKLPCGWYMGQSQLRCQYQWCSQSLVPRLTDMKAPNHELDQDSRISLALLVRWLSKMQK